MVLILVCLLSMAAARRITLPRPLAVALGVGAVCYFLVSATVVGGGISGQDLRGLLTLSAVLLALPVIAGQHAETRRAAVVFAFSAACVALLEIPASRSSLASAGSAPAVNGAAVAAAQTGALNHNTEGALFVVALAVLLGCLPRARQGMTRVAALVLTAALLAGVAYSFSRSAISVRWPCWRFSRCAARCVACCSRRRSSVPAAGSARRGACPCGHDLGRQQPGCLLGDPPRSLEQRFPDVRSRTGAGHRLPAFR